MNKSIILLSGGLDSLVSLGLAKDEYNIDLALTFNYGQKSFLQEVNASKEICKYYNIKHEVIDLPFLKNITQTSLVSEEEVPLEDYATDTSAAAVWVPNRNGLFLNIAAAYADSYKYTHILFGANKEEGTTFPDNTPEFVERINGSFKYSTMQQVHVFAPLINYDKNEIVRVAIEKNIPLKLVRSCYVSAEKNCGNCESCKHLKNALEYNKAYDLIEELF